MSEIVITDFRQSIHSNATLTSSGSIVVSGFGGKEISLIINVTASPTGTTPTLQYTIQEVDPGNLTTVFGPTVSSTSINSIGIQKITLPVTTNGAIQVSWTVTGGSPSFTGVYSTLVNKVGSTSVLYDSSGSAIGSASNPVKTDPTGTTTQPVSGTVTANQGTANTLANAWPQKITDGTNTAGVDSNNHIFVAGKSATGVAPTGNPISISGIDPGGLKRIPLTTTTGAVRQVPDAFKTSVHSNSTITTSGSTIITNMGYSEIYLVVNVQNAPTGTTPTLTFTLSEVDPGDQTTAITGQTASTTAFTAARLQSIQLADLNGDTIKVSWTITGASASFTGVYTTVVGHVSGNAIEGQAENGSLVTEGPVIIGGVDTSNFARYIHVDTNGNLVTVTAGAATTSSAGFSLGTVTVASSALTAIRASTYNEQAANAQRSISSASASDTSAGTGARQVLITYYDSSGNGPSTETVTLNGTTAVNTVSTTICFIESIIVTSVGSGGSNAGILTLFVGTGGAGGTLATINAGDNQDLWSHHYVPNGKTAYVTGVSGNNSNSSNGSVLTLRKKSIGSTAPETIVSDFVHVGGSSTAQTTRTYNTPIKITGPARLLLYTVNDGTPSITVRASFDFYDQ